MLRFGRGLWPGIALGAFLANASNGQPLPIVFGIMVGNALEAMVGSVLIRVLVQSTPLMGSVRDVFALLGAGASCAMVSASTGVVSMTLGDALPWAR